MEDKINSLLLVDHSKLDDYKTLPLKQVIFIDSVQYFVVVENVE